MRSYKRRRLRLSEPVEVYRNLRRGAGVWYSLRQRGRVVAHAQEVTLIEARFVVHEAGRRRVLATGQKNVHAFVVGRIVVPNGPPLRPGRSARYSPVRGSVFEVADRLRVSGWAPLHAAAGARLDADGLSVW